MKKWDEAGRLYAMLAADTPDHRLSTLEAVPKDATQDRQIIDDRGPSGEEGRLIADDRFLPTAPMWCELSLGPEEVAAVGSSDLDNCYHQPDVTEECARRTPVGKPLPAGSVPQLGAVAAGNALVRWSSTTSLPMKYWNDIMAFCSWSSALRD